MPPSKTKRASASAGSNTPPAKKPRLTHQTSRKAPSVLLQKRTRRVDYSSCSGNSDNSASASEEEVLGEEDQVKKTDEGHTLGPLRSKVPSTITWTLTIPLY
jgi:hypothetical protein